MFLQLFLMEAVLGPLSSDQNYHLLYCLNIFKAVCTHVFLCQYFSLKNLFSLPGVSLKYFLRAILLLSSPCFVRLNRPSCFSLVSSEWRLSPDSESHQVFSLYSNIDKPNCSEPSGHELAPCTILVCTHHVFVISLCPHKKLLFCLFPSFRFGKCLTLPVLCSF